MEEQLESFSNQVTLPDELVVSDDRSTDSTVIILKKYASKAKFEVYYSVNQTNLGYAENFNRALQRATGDIVFLSDQDDVWFPEKINEVKGVFEADGSIGVVLNNACITNNDLIMTGRTLFGEKGVKSHGGEVKLGCCMAIRKEFLDAVLPIPTGLFAHDEWIANVADCMGAKILHHSCLQLWRRHGSATSQFRLRGYYKRRILRVLREVRDAKLSFRLKQLCVLKHHIELLTDGDSGLALSAARGQESVRKIDELSVILKARIQVREAPLLERISKIWSLAMQGGYGGLNGVKNILTDFFSSRAMEN